MTLSVLDVKSVFNLKKLAWDHEKVAWDPKKGAWDPKKCAGDPKKVPDYPKKDSWWFSGMVSGIFSEIPKNMPYN